MFSIISLKPKYLPLKADTSEGYGHILFKSEGANLINSGDYYCSEPLYLPKATSLAGFDNKNCSPAK